MAARKKPTAKARAKSTARKAAKTTPTTRKAAAPKPKTAAVKPNANVSKARKLIEADAAGNAFKVSRIAEKLEPHDALDVLVALAAAPGVGQMAFNYLLKAQARAGRFDDAILTAKNAVNPDGAAFAVGEQALEAGQAAAAAKAFAAIQKPDLYGVAGLALAQKHQNQDCTKAAARLDAMLVALASKPVDWTDVTSCYDQVNLALGQALLAVLRGDLPAAKKVIAAARERLAQVKRKDVRGECLQQLKTPTYHYGGSVVAFSGVI